MTKNEESLGNEIVLPTKLASDSEDYDPDAYNKEIEARLARLNKRSLPQKKGG